MAVEPHKRMVPARLGGGTGWFVAAGLAFVLAIAMSAGAGEEPGLGAFAGFLFALSAGLTAVGFWVRLFGVLERRMMAIEAYLKWPDQMPPAEAGSPAINPGGRPSELDGQV
jgi:hypothetical protein